MSGIVGAPEMLDLEHLDDHRVSTIAYRIASYWAMEKLRDPNQAPKPHLFQHARRIVLDWLNSDRIVCKGGTRLAQLQYRQLTEEVCEPRYCNRSKPNFQRLTSRKVKDVWTEQSGAWP